MRGKVPLEPAPSRGCYDRALSRQARQSEQRERLVGWIAEVYRQRGERATVQDVVAASGVGRNTFYEYFDDLEHGLSYASQTLFKGIHERIGSELSAARTPIARLRLLSRLWVEVAQQDAAAFNLLARPASEGALSQAAKLFRSLLKEVVADTSAGVVRTQPAWEVCAGCAAAGAGQVVLTGEAGAAEMQEALATLLQRVFR